MILLERFKREIEDRGGRGLVALRRQFKLFDSSGNGFLEFDEFKRAIEDFEIQLHPKDMENLFKSFDRNHDGHVSYKEFLHSLIGQMNKFRYELVHKAYTKLDPYGEGVHIEDMFSVYDGSRHPDVAMGKMGPEDADQDFRETFEMHHNSIHDYNPNALVTENEFLEYYAFISSMTSSDHSFDLMVNGCWNLDNKNNVDSMPYAGTAMSVFKIDSHQKWKEDHHKKMFVGNEYDLINPHQIQQHDWQTINKVKY